MHKCGKNGLTSDSTQALYPAGLMAISIMVAAMSATRIVGDTYLHM